MAVSGTHIQVAGSQKLLQLVLLSGRRSYVATWSATRLLDRLFWFWGGGCLSSGSVSPSLLMRSRVSRRGLVLGWEREVQLVTLGVHMKNKSQPPRRLAFFCDWWAPRESNSAPTDYESAALTRHELEARRGPVGPAWKISLRRRGSYAAFRNGSGGAACAVPWLRSGG